jgi:hypothetical protein
VKRKASENFELAPDASGQVLIFTEFLWLMRHRQSLECWGKVSRHKQKIIPPYFLLYAGIFGKVGISGIA